MSISIEAREVLTHLNALGYRNISADQLKEFMRDLKKLIKYENRIGALSDDLQYRKSERSNEPSIFDKLHDKRTTSVEAKYGASRNKSRSKNASPARELQPKNILKEENPTKPCNIITETQNTVRPLHNAKDRQYNAKPCSILKESRNTIKPCNLQLKMETQSRPESAMTTCGKQKSTLDSGRRPKTPKSARKSKSEGSSQGQKENRMWIRPRLDKPQPPKTMDAVQLYHFYQKEWAKFKQQLPGENDHSQLRWQIRHKLMGNGS